MNRDEGLATALFAVIIGGAVALAIVNDMTAPACKAARSAIQTGKDFDFGCLEFWLNRYQSFLGSLLTASVAAGTLYWIAGQFRAADRQAAASAAQSLRIVQTELGVMRNEAADELRAAGEMHVELYFEEPAAGAAAIDAKFFNKIAERGQRELNEAKSRIQTWSSQRHGGDIAKRIDAAFNSCSYATTALYKLEQCLTEFELAKVDFSCLSAAESLELRSRITNAVRDTDEHYDRLLELVEAIDQRRAEIWDQVRSFEASAMRNGLKP